MFRSYNTDGGDFDHLILAGPESSVSLPENTTIAQGGLHQAGPDLVVQTTDGQQILVQDFYTHQSSGLTTGNHFYDLTMIQKLATSPNDGLYAQAGPSGAISEAIGQIETSEGSVSAVRADGSSVTLQTGDPVFQGDVIRTASGSNVGITFKDESAFSLDENGEIVLDEMVFDPDTSTGSFTTSLTSGVFSFVSGQIAKANPDAMTITTPVATIGIRGTQGVLDQGRGGELKAALMEEAGGFTGELILTNAGGSITLNQPNQFSAVVSFNASPGQPVTLNMVQITGSFGTTSLRSLHNARKASSQRRAQEKEAEAQADQQAAEQAQAQAAEAKAQADELAAQAEALAAQAAQAEGAEAEALAAEAAALAAQAAEAEAAALEAAAQAETAAAEAEAAALEAAEAQNKALEISNAANAFDQAVSQIEQQITKIANLQRQLQAVNQTGDTDVNVDGGEDIAKAIQAEVNKITATIVQVIETTITKEIEAIVDETEETVASSVAAALKNIDKTLVGTDGSDSLTGSSLRDGIAGLGGNDYIYGLDGVDVIVGGSGNDYIVGGEGGDFIHGDIPSDITNFKDIYSIVSGDGGTDATGSDTIYGGNGNDVINGGEGSDYLYGDADNDTINGNTGDDYIHGGTGNDTLSGDLGVDTLVGEAGADKLYGGDGNDTLFADNLYMGTLSGSTSNDILSGEAGNDTLYADYGADSLSGGDGDDFLYGFVDSLQNGYSGGANTDTLDLATWVTNMRETVTLQGNGSGAVSYYNTSSESDIGTDIFSTIEILKLGAEDDNVDFGSTLGSVASAGVTVQGNSGTDTVFVNTNGNFDMQNLTSLQQFEQIFLGKTDQSYGNGTTLVIDQSISGINTISAVKVLGDASDTVNLINSTKTWVLDGQAGVAGYNVFSLNDNSYSVQIQQGVSVAIDGVGQGL